jgi:NitT/TauT family transport system substrate-binding protein
MTQNRRKFLGNAAAGAAALGLSSIGFPAIAQGRTKIRVGYLHTLAVDGQMWLAQHLGAWAKNNLEPEFRQFTTGLELFQAMVGGSIDMLSTGAVISNFPARGQGRCSSPTPWNSRRRSSGCDPTRASRASRT